jgi:hypothetical protein
LAAQDGIEDGLFLRNIKAFLDGIWFIFHALETCKSTTHNPGSAPTSFTMKSVPSHNGLIFIMMALLQQTKMKGNASEDILSRGYHLQHAAD